MTLSKLYQLYLLCEKEKVDQLAYQKDGGILKTPIITFWKDGNEYPFMSVNLLYGTKINKEL
jgi:hypothetical protein